MKSFIGCHWKTWAIFLAVWTLLGIFFSTQILIAYSYADQPISIGRALTLSMTNWYIWAALTPVIVWLAHRFRFEKGRRALHAAVHLLASGFIALVQLAVYDAVLDMLSLTTRPSSTANFHANVLTYWAVVGVSFGIEYYRKYRERELAASQLEAHLAEARLQVLRMQIQPHFLFNTLNTIAELIHEDPEVADEMIARLSELLRLTLEQSEDPMVPLADELEFLKRYLEIERTRFRDRLEVRYDIAPAALAARVPHLILQPLVENAIRHGIAPRATAGSVEVRAARDDGMLRLAVVDDGPGLKGGSGREGVGLRNTRSRLSALYGDGYSFELAEPAGGGVEARIAIPWREHAAEDADA